MQISSNVCELKVKLQNLNGLSLPLEGIYHMLLAYVKCSHLLDAHISLCTLFQETEESSENA